MRQDCSQQADPPATPSEPEFVAAAAAESGKRPAEGAGLAGRAPRPVAGASVMGEVHRLAGIGAWHWMCDSDTIIWSEELYRIFGRDPGLPAPSYLEHLQCYTPESRARVSAEVQNTLATGDPYQLEVEIVLPNGSTRWISVSAEAEVSAAGVVTGLRGTAADVTQRKHAEERLALSEARYRSLVRATADIVWTARPDGAQLDEILEWEAFTGRRGAGWGWLEAIHPDERQQVAEKWKEAVATGSIHEMEVRMLRHDGVYRNMLVRAAPVRDSAGSIAEWVGTHSDITARKTAEEALRQQAELLDLAHDTILVCDLDGRVRFWNRSAERMYGYSRQQATGSLSHDLLRTEFPQPLPEIIETLLRQERWEGELVQTASGGARIVVSSRWVLQRDESGRPVGILKTHTDITQRKRAEEENRKLLATVQEERDRLSALISSVNDEVWFSDAQGVLTWVNPAAVSEFNLKTSSGIEFPAMVRGLEVFRPDGSTRPVEEAPLLRALRGEIIESLDELVRIPTTGELRHRQISSAPVRDASGTIIGSVCVARDITEQKVAEVALRESQSRFRKLFESDLMGIAIPDRYGAFSDCNDEFLRIVGYTRDDFREGKVRWDLMTPPEYQGLDAMHIAEAGERGSCTPYEKEYIRKDGVRVPILCGYALLEGSQDRYIGFVQDMSAKKAAEREIVEREQRFRVLAESLPEFVWMRDARGNFDYCNQRLLEYVGKNSEWMNDHAFDAIHPDDRSRALDRWEHSLATGDIYENEYRLRRHDGVYRYFLTRAVPIRDQGGRIERWLGSSTDIHDQKLAEEAVRRSEKLATAGRLAASMAHEINNPLAAVVNTLYLALQDRSVGANTRALLEAADRELARVAQFVTQTLRFHRQSSAPGEADLGEIMDSVLAMYAPRLRSSAIQVHKQYRTHTRLRCYSSEMRQVFANLIGNALDAIGEQGRIAIHVGTGREPGAEGKPGVRVSVADDGDGIPAEMQSRIFEPFFSTKEATGVGLGLWVTQSLVQKHGGRITLRSCTGPTRHGTVFSLLFPLSGPV